MRDRTYKSGGVGFEACLAGNGRWVGVGRSRGVDTRWFSTRAEDLTLVQHQPEAPEFAHYAHSSLNRSIVFPYN